MALSPILKAARLAVLTLPLFLIIGCASVQTYRSDAVVVRSEFAVIENYGTTAVVPEQVDGLLREVAGILGVELDAAKPKVRILVTTPERIAALYRASAVVATHGADAEGLYFPGASLVLVPHFDRTLLGHELAHYITDHYLKNAARQDWEKIAYRVERKLS